MSDAKSSIEIAWDVFLAAEHFERMCFSWAPSRADAATERRVVAARALHRMGIDISLMRWERAGSARDMLAEHFALLGIVALVGRKACLIVAELPARLARAEEESAERWSRERGIVWVTSTYHHAPDGVDAGATMTFRLGASKETFPQFDPPETPTRRTEQDEERTKYCMAGRSLLGERRYEATFREKMGVLARRIMGKE